MEYHYKTKGTCSRRIDVELEDGRIKAVKFHGGCNGNLQGITALIQGAPTLEIIRKCKGIQCGMRGTSCPDQLAHALEEALAAEKL